MSGEFSVSIDDVRRMERRMAAIKASYKGRYGVELTNDQAMQAYKEENMPLPKNTVEGIPGGYFEPFSDERILGRAEEGDTFSGTKP